MELRIREFRKEDMDALYFLNQRCHPPERRPRYHRILDTLLDRDVAALVAEEVEQNLSRLVGGLIVQGDPWNQRLFIVSLLVDAEYRRLGIARRLLGWAERLGEGFRCHTLLVPLEAGNADGAAFLAAQGFHESDEGKPFFSDPARGRLWVREAAGAERGPAAAGEAAAGEGREGAAGPAQAVGGVTAAGVANGGGGADERDQRGEAVDAALQAENRDPAGAGGEREEAGGDAGGRQRRRAGRKRGGGAARSGSTGSPRSGRAGHARGPGRRKARRRRG